MTKIWKIASCLCSTSLYRFWRICLKNSCEPFNHKNWKKAKNRNTEGKPSKVINNHIEQTLMVLSLQNNKIKCFSFDEIKWTCYFPVFSFIFISVRILAFVLMWNDHNFLYKKHVLSFIKWGFFVWKTSRKWQHKKHS